MIKISSKKFDPKNPPDGVWAKYAEGAEIQIRKLNGEVFRALRQPFVTASMEYDPTTQMIVPKENVDTVKYSEALNDYVMQNFRGFGDEDGVPIPVNSEGRKHMMNDLSVSDFVMNYAKRIELVEVKAKEEEIKK